MSSPQIKAPKAKAPEAKAAKTKARPVPPSASGRRLSKTSRTDMPAPAGNRDATKSSMLHIRLDDSLKADASRTLEEIGISLPEAIRVFLRRVVRNQAFPFPLHVPNVETAAALRESMTMSPNTFASAEDMFDALEKNEAR